MNVRQCIAGIGVLLFTIVLFILTPIITALIGSVIGGEEAAGEACCVGMLLYPIYAIFAIVGLLLFIGSFFHGK